MSADLKGLVTNLSLIIAGLNACVLLILFVILKKEVLQPMVELTKATEDISLGRMEGTVVNRSKNEFGLLAASIERLRVSMLIAIKRLATARKSVAGADAEEWKNVILEKKNYGFEFMALRILVGRLSVNYRNNPTQKTMQRCIQQLIDFFRNEKNPLAQKDLKKIFGGVTI
jgi:HAMP domain-containing protein